MRVTPVAHDLELNKPTIGYVRTPGVHMSDLYNSLYKKLNPKRYGGAGGPDSYRMELGSAFEEVLEIALAERILGERPGEFVTQHTALCARARVVVRVGDGTICPCGAGVIFSPDHLIFNGVSKLGEFKCTWMSIRFGIEDERFDKWFCQMKVYAHHLGLTHARLYVFFVNGDYSYKPPNGGPHIQAFDIEFTKSELLAEWNMLVRHAKKEGLLP